jgi:hypothetical protein
MWNACRWQTFKLMEAQCGTEGMHKNNLFKPENLLPFYWDEKEPDELGGLNEPLTDEEVKGLQADIDRANAEGTPW